MSAQLFSSRDRPGDAVQPVTFLLFSGIHVTQGPHTSVFRSTRARTIGGIYGGDN